MAIIFDKNAFKKELQRELSLKDIEFLRSVEKKDWRDVINFIKGFESCLRLLGEEPMNEKEVSEFLKNEAISFLYKKKKN
jgi:hypothetical protein